MKTILSLRLAVRGAVALFITAGLFVAVPAFAQFTYSRIKSFNASSDGESPTAAVTEATDGALYGTARFWGPSGAGTVFKLNKSGAGFTVLHTFPQGGADARRLTLSAAGTNAGGERDTGICRRRFGKSDLAQPTPAVPARWN